MTICSFVCYKKYIYYPRCTCKQAINYILLFIWHYKLQTVPEMLVNWWWWQMHKSFGHWIELYFGWIQNDKKKELPHAHSHHNASSYKYMYSMIVVVTPISLLTVSFQMKLIIIISQYSCVYTRTKKTNNRTGVFFSVTKRRAVMHSILHNIRACQSQKYSCN